MIKKLFLYFKLSVFYIIKNFVLRFFSQNLKIEKLTVQINKEVCELEEPITIVQLSDIHYDFNPLRINDTFLNKIINITNSYNPDLVLITGDLIDRDPLPITDLYRKHLSHLKSKLGVYSILGNHDYKGGEQAPIIIKNALKNTNVNLMENEIVYPSDQIQLIGFDSYAKRDNNKLSNVYNEIKSGKGKVRIALLHNPDHVVQLQENNLNLDLVLSGHTHGGQICLPTGVPLMPYFEKFLKKMPKPIRNIKYPGKKTLKNWKFGKGYHTVYGNDKDNSKIQIYINRGLGTHPPIRLFCDPEITLITIKN
ncbi:hypothetical protein DICPUDRAFT_154278 [Dictyostelium purpureum]|uniref:Calcineurin-like phosphoesterase domain-containing protein n=1 Tax=Dictyostelium purpureum TaxID=5786 RepID=F0ZQX4_DICPU|nr:uncharacterized protein DICPUDRAFT_154278 [Dictyostelium purpureum]EGC33656.1 hypothetical protein DICPUDRAFT_154278 [Dictyostelium purpureum]|eukprot:XP_003289826.1 hypothetical protein DICPUDRAFT_154278 [Dictyostelium purpureum]